MTPYSVHILYHGVSITFHVENLHKKNELETLAPASWLTPPKASALQVYWHNPATSFLWNDDPHADCEIVRDGSTEFAVQRDFAASLKNDRVILFSPYDNADGFFNAMRWLLPRLLLSKNTALLHSSCVVGRDRKARFFLGPSGAGKTTVTSLREERDVLGDDMNVFSFGPNGAHAELGLFGQAVKSPILPDAPIPVAALFFLKQSPHEGVRKMQGAEAARRFAASCANLFWPELGHEMAPAVFDLAMRVARTVPCFELEFNLSGGFWKYVDGEAQTL